jgi:hypothetical protein
VEGLSREKLCFKDIVRDYRDYRDYRDKPSGGPFARRRVCQKFAWAIAERGARSGVAVLHRLSDGEFVAAFVFGVAAVAFDDFELDLVGRQ